MFVYQCVEIHSRIKFLFKFSLAQMLLSLKLSLKSNVEVSKTSGSLYRNKLVITVCLFIDV